MDVGAILTVVGVVAAAVGGFFGGKRSGQSSAVGTAVDVVELLQVQVGLLTEENGKKDMLIADLRARVGVLENLVTQRAEVEAVHLEVVGVRNVVDTIAERLAA